MGGALPVSGTFASSESAQPFANPGEAIRFDPLPTETVDFDPLPTEALGFSLFGP